MDKDKVVAIITKQLKDLEKISDDLDQRLPQWKSRTIRFLSDKIIDEELGLLNNINAQTWPKEKDLYKDFLVSLLEGLEEIPVEYLVQDKNNDTAPHLEEGDEDTISKNVFVVHGHDNSVKIDVARTLEKFGLNAIILHEQSNKGRTIIEKFEQHAAVASFAVILLTSDDVGYPKNKEEEKRPRARQNVILELGYFCGFLGRRKICVLHKGEVEIPTDYLGVIYIPFDDRGLWRYELAKEMRNAGLAIDLNRLV